MAQIQGIGSSDLPPTSRPGPLDLERLRAENERLRARVTATETLAEERRRRIDDLLAALEGLPHTWLDHLERAGRLSPPRHEGQAGEPDPATAIEVEAARSPEPPSEEELAAARASWQEIRRLRGRLEGERLDREIERMRNRTQGDGLRPAS